jgi:hypothetical protein
MRAELVAMDARELWGRVHVEVRPVAGTGSAWISAERVEWAAEPCLVCGAPIDPERGGHETGCAIDWRQRGRSNPGVC